jgi:hypothetical protein
MTREVWDEAERIRLKRSKNRMVETTGNRERYTRQYAFSRKITASSLPSSLDQSSVFQYNLY